MEERATGWRSPFDTGPAVTSRVTFPPSLRFCLGLRAKYCHVSRGMDTVGEISRARSPTGMEKDEGVPVWELPRIWEGL